MQGRQKPITLGRERYVPTARRIRNDLANLPAKGCSHHGKAFGPHKGGAFSRQGGCVRHALFLGEGRGALQRPKACGSRARSSDQFQV
jgi:hypothetical protein